jgi:perosamine synthetase
MKRPLYYGHQYLDQEDEEAVLEVLRADRLTQGPYVDRFEAALREYFGPAHAVTCSSGTAALHLAALCLKWDAEDVVLVPAITFAASANCCRYVGAEPFFVDIQDDTLTIDPNEVERHVKRLRDAGRRVRAVVGVDMAGHPCDWPALRQIADRYDLQLVGDSCHAMGALISDGSKIGACRHTDVTILSFHPVKHITTGEGGALLTNDASIAERAAQLRSHGIKRDGIADWEGPWHYDMRELGYNYRLTDLQSALGISQMRKLDRFLARRRELAALYVSAFRDAPRLRCPSERAPARHAYHLFIARIDFANAPLSRRELFEQAARHPAAGPLPARAGKHLLPCTRACPGC